MPNPITNINIQTAVLSNLEILVYDVSGRLVKTIINEIKKPNLYSFQWNGLNNKGDLVSTGIYFIQIRSGTNMITQKVALLK